MVKELLPLGGSKDPVEAIRAFNRFYTKVIGLLEEGHLDSPYSLSEVRVLFELAQQTSTEVAALRAGLGLDAGYLSRILARLQTEALIDRVRSTVDARRQTVSLTTAGKEIFSGLNSSATKGVEELIKELGQDDRQELVMSMRNIWELLSHERADASIATPRVLLRAPKSGDFGWVVERHGTLYQSQYHWDESFESLVAHIVADYIDLRDETNDAAWIAELDGRRIGCVFCVHETKEKAKLRLLLVEPSARGHGIGQLLIDTCIGHARATGHKTLVLWTNDVLVDARRLYDRAGFELVAATANRLFGHDLVSETLSLTL